MSILNSIIIFAAVIYALAIAVAFRYQPDAIEFERTETVTGTLTYGGRNVNVELDGSPVYSSASAFGGESSGIVGSIPNGSRVTVSIARITTLLGKVPVLMEVRSEDGRAKYFSQSSTEFSRRMKRNTLFLLIIIPLLLAGLCCIASAMLSIK